MCPTKLLISPSPPKTSISPRKTESWVEAWFIGKNHIFLHSKWAFNDSQLLRQSDQLRNLSEEHHGLSCFYLDSHWDNGESLLAYPTKDVACSSWVCSSLGATGLPCLLSMAPFFGRPNFPTDWALESVWSEPWGISESNHQGEPWEAGY